MRDRYRRGGSERDFDGRDPWADDGVYRGGSSRGSGTHGAETPARGFAGGYGGGHRDNADDYGDPRGYRDLEAGVGRDDTIRQSHRGKGPKNYQRSDDRIREDVCERLFMDHEVDASDIEVTVNAGTVTLTGTVSDRRAKRRAEDISEAITGVKDVENQIRVHRGPA